MRFAKQDQAVYAVEGLDVYKRMIRSCRRFQEAIGKRGEENPFQVPPGDYGFTTDSPTDYSEALSTYPSFVSGDKYAFTVLRNVSRMIGSLGKTSGVDSFTPSMLDHDRLFDAAFRDRTLAYYSAIDASPEHLERIGNEGGDLTLFRRILLARAGYWQDYLWHDKEQLRDVLTGYQDALRSGLPPAVRFPVAGARPSGSSAGQLLSANVSSTLTNVCPPVPDAMHTDAPVLRPFDMDRDLSQHFQESSGAAAAASAATPSQVLRRSRLRTLGDAESLKDLAPSQLFPDTPAAERPVSFGYQRRPGTRDLWRPVITHPLPVVVDSTFQHDERTGIMWQRHRLVDRSNLQNDSSPSASAGSSSDSPSEDE